MQSRRGRRRTWRRRFKIFWLWTEILVLLFLAITLGVVGGTFYSVSKYLPTGPDLTSYKPTESTRIISSDGVTLAEVYEENREIVSLSKIPQDLQNATVAIEDKRFFNHKGVDLVGIARAVFQNVRTGHMGQGGSTLTQQLARNIYLTREKKLSRKLQEIVLAIQLERNYTKEQILELYMNQVFYGSGSYGVQTASKVYFGKEVKDLTLAECALLAGLPQRPSSYSPYEDVDAAIKRRDVVLDKMAEQGYITPDQRDEAKNKRVRLSGIKPGGIAKYKAPWFVNYVIKELTQKYGEDLIYRGGLRVYTTLNYEMQKVGEKELREHVNSAKSRRVSQGALICIDPETGYIKAMVGGVNPNFTEDQYNRVLAHRQPGSSFKAFVYTAAIDNGYDQYYKISNAPITYKGKPWPKNYTSRGQSGSSYTIEYAVAQSINRCAVNMADKIGIDQVIMYARMLGIKSPLDRNFSLALGAYDVTPLEMCSAYGVFAAKGIRAEPMSIVRITQADGERESSVIEDNKPVTHQVLSEQTAEIMNDIFRKVVTSGTGYAARRVPDAHGKTGTTSDDRDAWWVGYTPQLVTAVWVGNDDYRITMRSVWGGNVCAPTWTSFMLKALEIHKKEGNGRREDTSINISDEDRSHRRHRDTPETSIESTDSNRIRVNICDGSGLVAAPSCPSYHTLRIAPGSEPLRTCDIHPGRQVTPPRENPTPAATEPEQLNPPAPPPPPAPPVRRPVETPRNPQPRYENYKSVTVCVDSGQIANSYCPETVTRRYPADEAPRSQCRIHKPPSR